MTTHFNGSKAKDIYFNGSKIVEAWYNGVKVYSSKLPSGTVIFESATPGTYTVTIPKTQTYHVDLVGAGGRNGSINTYNYGGSGAYIYGNTLIEKGDYTLKIGAANGGVSTFLGNTAGGGGNGADGFNQGTGSGGKATVVSQGLTGQNGIKGSKTGWINGYGAGGGGSKSAAGKSGYCKIYAL